MAVAQLFPVKSLQFFYFLRIYLSWMFWKNFVVQFCAKGHKNMRFPEAVW